MVDAVVGPVGCRAISIPFKLSPRGTAELGGQCSCGKSRSLSSSCSASLIGRGTSLSWSRAGPNLLAGRSNGISALNTRDQCHRKLMALKQMGVTSDELLEKPFVDENNVLHNFDIPVIDMSRLKSDRDGVRKQIRDAAVEWGFFQVINHGIPLQDLQELQSQGFQFFESPIEVKRRAMGAGGQGVFHADNRKLKGSALEWAQSLMLTPFDLDITVSHIWPDGNAKFRDAVKKFCVASDSLHEQFLLLLAESLGLASDFFSRHLNSKKTIFLRWNFYPPAPETSEILGASSHTDGCCITVLQQDNVGGLQIQKDGHWVNIAPVEGALVINIGDILHAWTNGILKSVLHRVVANKSVSRLSLAAFLSVDRDLLISAPEELVDEEHPRLYRPFGSMDYIDHIIAVRSSEQDSSKSKDGLLILEGFKLQK